MTLIGTTPLTRYPRLHPDMGYLRTNMSPALNPMTLNDLLISNFQAYLPRPASRKTISDTQKNFPREISMTNYRLRSALATNIPAARCALTNATHPPFNSDNFPRINLLH